MAAAGPPTEVDVLALKPSEYLSENEIAAAALADQGERFNPQQQFPVRWPDHPVVALAYLDQLERSGALPATSTSELRQALTAARTAMDARRSDRALAGRLQALAGAVRVAGNDPIAVKRAGLLQSTLGGIAGALR